MSGCPSLRTADGSGLADAMRVVDCMSGQATETAFARMFGAHGGLTMALTSLLTLYVALLAIGLLTGRSRLGLSMLTPRALSLGLALTFASSWVAYQSVVWNLAIGAPDQIAGIILGTRGSATSLFAHRLDQLFTAVADAARSLQAGQGDKVAASSPAAFSPATILWLAAFLLLLGTVGILIVTRIVLAALLAIGPLFVILSLFPATRGLFEGWLKSLVLFAVTPLFAVLIGSGALALMTPVVASLDEGEIDLQTATTVLLGAIVYCALIAMVLKLAVTLTSGWRLPRHGEDRSIAPFVPLVAPQGVPVSPLVARSPANAAGNDRRAREIALAATGTAIVEKTTAGDGAIARLGPLVAFATPARAADNRPSGDARLRGIGSRYRPATPSAGNRP